MAIKAHNAGSLSFTEIVAEWGGSTPHGLDEYHSGESLVYAGATGAPGGTTTTIPSSGTISFSNFYGSEAFVNSPGNVVTITTPGTTTATVPAGANTLYIIRAVGAGGEGLNGLGYDRAGSESSGPGGGAGAHIKSHFFAVSAGETITFTVGAGGSGIASNSSYSSDRGYGNPRFSTGFGILWGDSSDADDGEATTISASSTGDLVTVNGGQGATNDGQGQVQGPLRGQGVGVGGTVGTVATPRSSGSYVVSGSTIDITGITDFNTSAAGGDGTGGNATNNQPGNHFAGDNSNGAGGSGGDSIANSGGAGDTSGSTAGGSDGAFGSGGGGGAALGSQAHSLGGEGGDGMIEYWFLQVN
tara:strand:- start:214 stop:1287 length:1074 start_codon:yes stop_codon:yes gene_type:complete